MSDEQTTETTETTETVDTANEMTENVEEVEQAEQIEETEEKPDLIKQAIDERARLEAEIEALKNSDTGNIFEQNAILKSELEDAQKLSAMAVENAELQAKLEGIKRETLIKSLGLNDKMKTWADSLDFDQLQVFAENMPRRKTILETQNTIGGDSDAMSEFKKEVNKSRIH